MGWNFIVLNNFLKKLLIASQRSEIHFERNTQTKDNCFEKLNNKNPFIYLLSYIKRILYHANLPKLQIMKVLFIQFFKKSFTLIATINSNKMKSRSLLVLCLFLCLSCQKDNTIKKSPPNVILIMTDDQGYGDLGCHGNPWIETPNLDQLHKESVRLVDFHVGTTCAPTRAGLLTGRNCNEVGVWHTIIGRNFLRQGETTIADILKANNYQTGIFGKWHLGDNHPYLPNDRGFEASLIHGGGGIGQTPDFWNNDYFDDSYFRNGIPEKFTGYCTDVWFSEAMKFIEDKKEAPFFCYITPNAPHGPFHVPQKYIDRYKNIDAVPFPNFYGMISNIDENIGKLRAHLKLLGIDDNTILIFMTDNGTSAGVKLDKNGFPKVAGYNAGMRGKKGSPYEGGHRVPCFIHWPDGSLAQGQDVRQITSYTDVVPTILDLCGIEHNATLAFEGKSIKPLLRKPSSGWEDRIIITDTQRKEFLTKWKDASIMNNQYRLIKGEELYNIKEDPGQKTDIANQNPDIVKQLRAAYESWWKRVNQNADIVNSIPVGYNNQTVSLSCHDIHPDSQQEPAWHQNHVRKNQNPTGYWFIDVKEKGTYSIAIHRYPIESETGFNALVPQGDKVDGGTPYAQGVSVNAAVVKLQIEDYISEQKVQSDDPGIVFEVELSEGEKELKSWIIDQSGNESGAYYAYVKKL